MTTFNQDIFLIINSFALHNNILDSSMIFIAEYMPYVFIAVEIYLYFIKKLKDEAIFAFYAVVISLIISKIISLFYEHNRPFVDNLGVTLSEHAPDNSFPSDHTTFMLSIAFSLFFYSKTKKLGLILLSIGLVGGFARVFEGVHYPFDIVGALVTGYFGATIIYLYRDKFKMLNNIIIKIV
jgi:undecaprenyl-diphosphatase